ncbi:hypothetical protein FO497_20510 [Bacillus cereus ATCC 10876]|uniref:hypothetical protein n=1 Tax=Bacillus TaxID=1386 RepID=UPI00019FF6D2|nr:MULTISPECIES: hypothetical protein [Bacillus]MDJ0283919.1 hypothetical protein [Bacillus bombysepticus]EEK47178.1 hypothetical protein bcere0002_58580 [Bacillus cereus ATCC 10876]KFL73740.1 hypothetical protein DJ50_894 [Bacillus cereus ATCC 10876]MBG9863588.1 hypothetical protein [Bacillus cereus]MBO1132568.1 hypothetical protein [Bacillus cereus]
MNEEEKKELIKKLQNSDVLSDFFADLNELYKKISSESMKIFQDIDWTETEKTWKNAAELLGKKGWTLPLLMDVEDNIRLSQVEDLRELDKEIVEYHLNEFQNMKREILTHEFVKEWKELLGQCFDNYEKGNYLIVIPNLFIVIESLAHMVITPKFQKYITSNKRISLKEKYKKVKPEIEKDRTNIIIYISVHEFLKSVFKMGNFDKNKNRFSIINRDWVLHGRDNPNNWNEADVLRLFNAIHTITQLDFLLEELEEHGDMEVIK